MKYIMDFMTLPPEVTSALIHSGPGAESLIEASSAWQHLSTGLEEGVPVYASVVSSVTGAWQGTSSVAMAQAVEPYLSWLRNTAQQCRQFASSTLAAAAAFNSAASAVVPPATVSANRTRLAQLLATNGLGRTITAIDHRRPDDGLDIVFAFQLRPASRLGWAGEPICEPVHLVRISHQPAQLCGAEQLGPGTADRGPRNRPGPVRGGIGAGNGVG
jgi:hypothetical protein